jgi:hypothetical protein
MSDLETIANLELQKVVERINREAQEKLQATSTMPRGGQLEHAKLMIQIEGAETMCFEYAQIWQNLLEEQNGGYLTRQNVNFILGKVRTVVAARKGSLRNPVHRRGLVSASGEIERRLHAVTARVTRDLELRIRRQEAFPKKKGAVMEAERPHINIAIHSAANVNLGTQVGTINAALSVMSEQGESNQEVVKALKDLTDAVASNKQLQETEKQETLEVIEEITKQARSKPESRSLGKIKALVAGLHTLVAASTDLSALWTQYAPVIKHFFLPGAK